MSDNSLYSNLHKLNRKQLLELFLEQSQETDALEEQFKEQTEQFNVMKESYERLIAKLDQKDAQIKEMEETYERLKEKLNQKDEKLNQKDVQLRANIDKSLALQKELEEEIHTHRVRVEELAKINEGIAAIKNAMNLK